MANNLPEFIDETKILVKNFPSDFLQSEQKQLLKLCGAVDVIVISKHALIGRFNTAKEAQDALTFLHQQPLKNCLLSAKYAKRAQTNGIVMNECSSSNELLVSHGPVIEKLNKFIKNLNNPNENWSFDLPPPPYLKYNYPKMTSDIVDSICIALATNQKFYIQVLHLMNRMNLEPPFMPGTKSLQFPTVTNSIATQTDFHTVSPDLASDESELESTSSLDEVSIKKFKRKRRQLKSAVNLKRIRAIIKAGTKQMKISNKINTNRTDVHDAFDTEKFSERNITIVAPATLQKTNENSTEQQPFIKNQTTQIENPKKNHIDFTANKLSANQLAINPLFQNYTPGEPSHKLYIKNLAKTVTEDDLRQIYQQYIDQNKDDIEIRLMKTGRMKGQAFVTFKNQYLDECNYEPVAKALRETNGVFLNDKVMVVMFGKK